MNRSFALAMPLLLLAGCQDEAPAETEAEAGRIAEGQVLGGTISDEMIPLDELRSRSPSLRTSEITGGEAGGSAAPAPDASETAEPEPEPATDAPEEAAPADPAEEE